jgi:hypothetical protein
MGLITDSVPLTHRREVQSWGSESNNSNAEISWFEAPKPRWQQIRAIHTDIAALERFGVDPTRPAGAGVVMQANTYGYPIEGYTTGYTFKLPPPANFEGAVRTPRSGNIPSVVEASDGTDGVPTVSGDTPVDHIEQWPYPKEDDRRDVEREALSQRRLEAELKRAGVQDIQGTARRIQALQRNS